MARDLSEHPYFERWTDPETGVESLILIERVAPLQKGLYYATPSISTDGRWLWFYGAFPPAKRWTVAAVCLDPDQPAIRLFPAAVGGGNPLVAPEGNAAYVVVGDGVYYQPFDGDLRQVLRMPRDIIANRYLFGLVTDLTISADGKHFLLDSHIGNRWLISIADVATGQVTPLRWFNRCHHHAQFSPVDPTLILVGQGPWHDPITGDKGDMNVRLWIMDTALTRYEPVFGDLWFNHNSKSCHEWWSADGRVCWVDYDDGVYECELAARTRELVWPHHLLCHAQCDAARRFYCADENPYNPSPERPCRVVFFDRHAGREVAIVSRMPLPPLPPGDWRSYHLDPHPHFSPDGQWIVYTTLARGKVDVALTSVPGVRERLE